MPKHVVIKKVIIKDVPEDMELENLLQQLNSDNQNKHPIPFRLKTKVKKTNKGPKGGKLVWKKSRAVSLAFRANELHPPFFLYRPLTVSRFSFLFGSTNIQNRHDSSDGWATHLKASN
jgi:hypothetical protein